MLKQPGRKASAPLTAEEKKAIDTVWNETRLGARLLFRELRRRGYRIQHHKLNRYLLDTGRTVPNPRKQRKRSRCRYEREHSLSLVHGDRHRWRFLSMHEFIVWYNNRMHGALWTDIAERPSEAIVRKLQPKSILGMFMEEVECR